MVKLEKKDVTSFTSLRNLRSINWQESKQVIPFTFGQYPLAENRAVTGFVVNIDYFNKEIKGSVRQSHIQLDAFTSFFESECYINSLEENSSTIISHGKSKHDVAAFIPLATLMELVRERKVSIEFSNDLMSVLERSVGFLSERIPKVQPKIKEKDHPNEIQNFTDTYDDLRDQLLSAFKGAVLNDRDTVVELNDKKFLTITSDKEYIRNLDGTEQITAIDNGGAGRESVMREAFGKFVAGQNIVIHDVKTGKNILLTASSKRPNVAEWNF